MEVYPESSSDRRGSSSGEAANSADSSGSSSGFERQPPAQGVPQYVDMVIPDYESSMGESAQGGAPQRENFPSASNETASDSARQPADQNNDEGEESDDRKPQAQSSEEESGCNPTDVDVLLSVSGEHPGNQQYRAVVRHLAKKYTKVKMGYRNAAVQILVSSVKAQGGRFLKCSRDGKWKEVSDKKAYSKACQAIRGTCRKVEVVSTRSRKRESSRRRSHRPSQEQRRQPNAEPRTVNRPEEQRNDLELVSLRLQTLDETLTHLALDLQHVDHDYLFPLAKALDTNDLLRSLDVRLSHMSRTNANALAWGIKRSKGLKQVRLSYGKLTEKESAIFIAGVLDNASIESLNLDDNGIGVTQLKALCGMVNDNKSPSLQRLSLENNSFGDEAAPLLAKLIASTKTIRFLNLGGNRFSSVGMNILRTAAKKKSYCLFEISGLIEADLASRKRPPSNSAECRPPEKRRTIGNTAQQLQNVEALSRAASDQEHRIYASSQTQSSSLDEAKGAPTGSDDPPSGSFGTDEGPTDGGPTSSMNDSDDTPGSSSS